MANHWLLNLVFTCNNYDDVDIERIRNCKNLQYAIWGYEVAPDTGTPHLQGYLELDRQVRFRDVKKRLGKKFHIEARKGTQKQARKYCKKSGNFEEIGKKKKQGERTDLPAVAQVALDQGIRAIIYMGSNLQQIRYAEKVLGYIEPVRDFKPYVVWIWGESGRGKSRKAHEMSENYNTYWKNDGSKWFDGYDRHECLVLDDVKASWFDEDGGLCERLLSITDRYPCRLQTKGSSRQLVASRIIITSINHPDVYDTVEGELIRRLSEVVHV